MRMILSRITTVSPAATVALSLTLGACATTVDPAPGADTRVSATDRAAASAPADATMRAEPPADPFESGRVGVLVMAHGGAPEWNRTVAEAVEPLAREVPVSVAFGMADPHTLAASLDTLRAAGVDRVAVVRMFLSGRSFLDQTEYFLGLDDAPPETFVLMRHGSGGGPEAGGGHTADAERHPEPIPHGLGVATHSDGLMTSPEAARIVAERVRSAGGDPADVSVLVVAHGMGDERDNDEVVRAMESIVADMADDYAAVEVATLREDWAEKREGAEQRIRGFVERESSAGRRVVVVPMRLSGFGPYAEVLDGLAYEPAEALLPHPAISDWMRGRAYAVACGNGWMSECAPATDPVDGTPRR